MIAGMEVGRAEDRREEGNMTCLRFKGGVCLNGDENWLAEVMKCSCTVELGRAKAERRSSQA